MYTENQIQIFVIISSIFLGLFILTTVYLIIKLKLNSILLRKSEERLKEYSEDLEKMVEKRTVQLEKSEKSYRHLYELNKGILENSPGGIIRLDSELKIRYENPEMRRILGVPSGKESKAIGMDIRELPSIKETGISAIFKDLLDGKEIAIEIPFTSIYGKETYITLKGVPIFGNDKFTGAVLLINDITERKRSEDKIKASLKEKEVMLKEIHHRVKNNMQVIISLLRLQARNIKNKQAIEIIRVSRNRIQSMALIHDRLYQSQDLAKISIAKYIQKLTTDLFRSYKISSNEIKTKINIADISLDINSAIPCGLIINELISNSLKHAFPKDKEGEINIDFHSDNNSNLTLIFSDNGIGFPEDIDFRNTESLGLQLVNILVKQLNGTIDFEVNGGTTFRITFPS